EFSFSGLKTSMRTEVERIRAGGRTLPVADICASFQRAVTESLLLKTKLAVKKTGVRKVALSGGVAANTALREGLTELGRRHGFAAYLPPKKYCTDNAIMIAAAGYAAYQRGTRSYLTLTADPSWEIWGTDS
ncbi:tRNA (adenosine(37)-N6)-threonylcarbamoyltransferase complex transferase subunit TsaD, partial [Synergistaceae bacterium OttesenSCG-928-I11]|nr:tRNA (adenosine(37)-N6)-threonylcarbamoyltransferase complex transferase subunit TsaD [Synergistaceae bacterium OttesenSCG-928-I11]